jgi:hypothetical protein
LDISGVVTVDVDIPVGRKHNAGLLPEVR